MGSGLAQGGGITYIHGFRVSSRRWYHLHSWVLGQLKEVVSPTFMGSGLAQGGGIT